MMENTVYIKRYSEPPFNMKEILRFAGAGKDERMRALADECAFEVKGKTATAVCFRVFPLDLSGEDIDLGFAETRSAALRKNLDGCEKIILFAATAGIEIDRLISFYSRISPTKAVFMQAVGAERIESLCNLFNEDMRLEAAKNGYFLKPRFSPGYGDLPLTMQKEIFSVLDCQRKIGLMLNESLLMSPSKSVTAIIGVGKQG